MRVFLCTVAEKKTCSLPLDIMIVLDHSASVKEPSFEKQTTFTRGFVSLLPVAKDKIRVGLIRYWHIVELVFDFDDFFNDTALEIVIGAMRRPTWHQRTSTGAAIQRMVETFTGDNGARDPTVATHVGIVITDGKATDSIADPLKAARSKNITMFAYGIGKSAFSEGSDQLRELREIASDASTVEVVDIDELNNLVNRLIDRFVNCGELFKWIYCVYLCTAHVCMYVCVHACMYVCMYVCMYACMYVCMYVCVCVCMYV